MMNKYAFKSLIKQCIAEVLTENTIGNFVVSYAVAGMEQIPDSIHSTKEEALKAAKDFIQSYNTPKSKQAGERIERISNGYALKHVGGGTIAIATISPKMNEESQPEPYDAETDTFAPSPRERTSEVSIQKKFEDEIEQLKKQFPKISFGYIGNYWTDARYEPRDDRSWYIWNGNDKFGGYDTEDLPLMWDEWQKKKEHFLKGNVGRMR